MIMKEDRLKIFRRKNIKIELSLFLLLVVGSVTFFPVTENNFTNWDDPAQLLDNPLVRKFSVRNLMKIFITPVVSEYHPLVTSIFSLEFHLFGASPFPYHLHSLILHLINGVLVFFLFLRLSGKVPVALAGSLLFMVHPLQVQAVAWMSARKDLVFSFFFLLSLLTYFQYYGRDKRFFYYFSILFFLAAIISKTVAVTFPAIILLWLWVYRRPLRKKDWIDMIPYLAVSLAFGSLALAMQTVRLPGSASHLDFSFDNVILLLRNLNFYISHLVFPFNLSPVYLFPKRITVWAAPAWPSLILIPALAVWFRKCRSARRIISWSSGFFLITIFPVLRFIPFTGIEVAANRFVYLPSIGIFCLAGYGYYSLIWAGENSRFGKIAVIISAVLVIIFLSGLSRNRCRVWRDSSTLWAEAVKTQEENDLLYHMLADSHFRAGRYTETIELCDQAIALNPAMAYSYLLKSRAQAIHGQAEASAETREHYNGILAKLGIKR